MNCSECRKKIKGFLSGSLNNKNTIEFIEHVKSCDECMEELSIEYIVTEGVKRLDSMTSFDLDKELEDKINDSYAKAKYSKYYYWVSGIVIVVVAFLLGLFLSTLFSY